MPRPDEGERIVYARRLTLWWAWLGFAALVVVFVLLPALLDADGLLLGRIIGAAIGVVLVAVFLRIARTRVVVTSRDVRVLNPFSTTVVPLDRVEEVGQGRAALFPCAVLRVRDGQDVPVVAADLRSNALTGSVAPQRRVIELGDAVAAARRR